MLFQRWVLRRAQSQAVSADSLHYVTDFASNIVVLVALVLAAWGWQRADAVLALLLGGWIFWSAAKIAIEAVNTLMDKALPPADVARIESRRAGRARRARHPRFAHPPLRCAPFCSNAYSIWMRG